MNGRLLALGSVGALALGAVARRGSRALGDGSDFDAWFANSRVVDADGAPRVVYHGTVRSFDDFGVADPQHPHHDSGIGFFFASDASEASAFTTDPRNRAQPARPGGRVFPCYLSLQRPVVYRDQDDYFQDLDDMTSNWEEDPDEGETMGMLARRILILGGYDGIVILDSQFGTKTIEPKSGGGLRVVVDQGGTWYIAFHAEQIRSAVGIRPGPRRTR